MIFFQEDDKGYEPARLEYYNNQRNWEAGEQVRLPFKISKIVKSILDISDIG